MTLRPPASAIRLYAVLFTMILLPAPAMAQFSSGSTGADGALNVTEDTTLPIPPDGVFNFTTITIAEDATLDFDVTTRNLPVIMLAQEDVVIEGTIDASGEDGRSHSAAGGGAPGDEARPGPGGGHGGLGGLSPANTNDPDTAVGTSGGGPGGGAAANNSSPGQNNRGRVGNGGSHFTAGETGNDNSNPPAPRYGDYRLIILSGGSGGAGGNINTTSPTSNKGPGGGAGGGAILIASSTSITVSGTITARGGSGRGWSSFGGGGVNGSGAGSGGAIRLMANSIGGGGSLDARGGSAPGHGSAGGHGVIRIEAHEHTGSLAGNTQPSATTGAPLIPSIPPSQQPRVRIVSIGGVAVPEDPGGHIGVPDVTIPESEGNPLTIQIEGINVPDGAVVTLRIPAANGDTIVTESTPLSAGTATATASIPAGPGAIYTTVAMPE